MLNLYVEKNIVKYIKPKYWFITKNIAKNTENNLWPIIELGKQEILIMCENIEKTLKTKQSLYLGGNASIVDAMTQMR